MNSDSSLRLLKRCEASLKEWRWTDLSWVSSTWLMIFSVQRRMAFARSFNMFPSMLHVRLIINLCRDQAVGPQKSTCRGPIHSSIPLSRSKEQEPKHKEHQPDSWWSYLCSVNTSMHACQPIRISKLLSMLVQFRASVSLVVSQEQVFKLWRTCDNQSNFPNAFLKREYASSGKGFWKLLSVSVFSRCPEMSGTFWDPRVTPQSRHVESR